MNKISSIVVIMLLVGMVPLSVFAETVVRTGSSVAVESDQVVEDDFYVAAETASISGEIKGDMYAFGGTITANGSIAEDMTAVGGSVQMHASVTDDMRVIAGEVVVADHVGGDLFVIAGTLKVLSTASVDGNIFFYGGEAEISGPVGKSVIGMAESVRIDASVGGGVDFTVSDNLVLGSRAAVVGDVKYKSQNEFTRAQDAVVEGEVLYTKSTSASNTATDARGFLLPAFIALFATLCAYLLLKDELQRFAQRTLVGFSKNGLIGLVALIVVPVVVVLLLVTVLGTLVGVFGLLLWILLLISAFVLMNIVCASLLAKLLAKSYQINLLWILFGALVVQAIVFVPFFGPFAIFILFTVTFGSLVHSLYRMIT